MADFGDEHTRMARLVLLMGHEVFDHIPVKGVFCRHYNTQVELQESREKRGHEDALLAYFDTNTTWTLHFDATLRRDLPGRSARVKILGAPGAYDVDWWSPEPGDDWKPAERGEFDDAEEPADVSHLA